MPKSKKRKEYGIMKGGGSGTGGGGTAVGPLMTPADVSLAEAQSQRLYDVLVQAIDTNQPVKRQDIVNYLLHTYNIERIGMPSVVLPGLCDFLDNFTPDALNVAKTSEFCQNLFGFKYPKFRELLTRDASNVTQCNKGGYSRTLPLVCIWCGEPIYDMAECEHSLPITPCSGLLGFSSNTDRPDLEFILEYGYAHRLCNQVKLDVPFLTWDEPTKKWKINWPNMRQVYNDIATRGAVKGYKNANLLAYTCDKASRVLLDSITGAPITLDTQRVGRPDDGRRGNYNFGNPRDVKNRNDLTENGEHRNKTDILVACGELARIINNNRDLLAGGSKSKKSKKKQRGGALPVKQPVDLRLIDSKPDLVNYLAQDLLVSGHGDKWLQPNNGKLYGPHRMRLIEEYCNRYTSALGTPTNLKYTVIARIVTSPTRKDLASAFAGAGGAVNPTKIALDAYNLLQVKLQKKIREFKTYTFNITDILKMRPRAQGKAATKERPKLVRLQAEKQSQFDEIQQLIDDHNTKYASIKEAKIGAKLKDDTVIPTDPTPIIDDIEKHITILAGLHGGGRIKKMKGGANSILAKLPEGLEKELEEGLSAKLEANPKLVVEEFIEEFLLKKELEELLEFNNFYSVTKEPQEEYIANIKALNKEFKTYQDILDSSINTFNIKYSNYFRRYLESEFTSILPELNHTSLGLSIQEKRIIFSAIVGTNVSVNTHPRDALEHIRYLNFMLFDTTGDELLKKRKYTEAILHYVGALRHQFPELYVPELKGKIEEARGDLSQSLGNNKGALEYYKKALKFLPDYPKLEGKLEAAKQKTHLETERVAREEAEAAVKTETERIAREEAETERIAREEAETERIAREEAETERIAREEAEATAKAEAERIAREEGERKAREEAERKAREEAEATAKAETDRIAREKAEQEQQAEAERQNREQPAAAGLDPDGGEENDARPVDYNPYNRNRSKLRKNEFKAGTTKNGDANRERRRVKNINRRKDIRQKLLKRGQPEAQVQPEAQIQPEALVLPEAPEALVAPASRKRELDGGNEQIQVSRPKEVRIGEIEQQIQILNPHLLAGVGGSRKKTSKKAKKNKKKNKKTKKLNKRKN